MEISKTTVAVLLVLTILVSVIGTWNVLQSVSMARVGSKESASTNAKISLTVEEPPKELTGEAKIMLNVQQLN
ncbi:MAG: hypothetical protein NTV63_02330 [Candidatus Woesearchaeota archaeon]|nr:hypothetical protein [Candidatus Woesearchaeota archaeon]